MICEATSNFSIGGNNSEKSVEFCSRLPLVGFGPVILVDRRPGDREAQCVTTAGDTCYRSLAAILARQADQSVIGLVLKEEDNRIGVRSGPQQ